MSRLSNNYTDERFAKLSEKISKLQNIEVKSPNKITDIETRIDNLQIESLRSLKDLEFKMKYLEDELLYITKKLEDSIFSKNTLRNRINNEIRETESKIKALFEQERENILQTNLEIFRNFENEYLRIQENNQKEKLDINNYIQNLRDVTDSDIGKLKNDSEQQSQAEMSENSNVDVIDDMIRNLKNQIETQKEKRNKFEENILLTIDETCKKLTRFIQEDAYVDED